MRGEREWSAQSRYRNRLGSRRTVYPPPLGRVRGDPASHGARRARRYRLRATGVSDTGRGTAKAVLYAREKQLDAAVRSGGHDLLGASVCEGLVIDLSRMNAIRMDRDARTVRVEVGARTAVLNGATQASELAVPLGCHPDVGVAGLTLGGGIG